MIPHIKQKMFQTGQFLENKGAGVSSDFSMAEKLSGFEEIGGSPPRDLLPLLTYCGASDGGNSVYPLCFGWGRPGFQRLPLIRRPQICLCWQPTFRSNLLSNHSAKNVWVHCRSQDGPLNFLFRLACKRLSIGVLLHIDYQIPAFGLINSMRTYRRVISPDG